MFSHAYGAEKLNHLSATPEQIKNAIGHTGIPTLIEMREFLSSKKSGKKVEFIQNDKKLFDVDEFHLEIFNKLTKYHLKSGKIVNLELPDFSECRSIYCVLSEVFDYDGRSEDLGIMYAYAFAKYKINPSHFVNDNSKTFTIDEFQSALYGLEALPESILPKFENKKFIRFNTPESERSRSNNLANSTMEFFDHWAKFDFYTRAYAVFHEMAHNLGAPLKIMYSDEWNKIAGWENINGRFEIVKATQTSLYAKEYPNEDFAEALSAFRFNPLFLKEKSLSKYEFIRWTVFKGIEFIDNGQMRLPSIEMTLQGVLDSSEPRQTRYHSENIDLSSCHPLLLKSYFYQDEKIKALKCIEIKMIKEVLLNLLDGESGLRFLVKNDDPNLESLKMTENIQSELLKDFYTKIGDMLINHELEVFRYLNLKSLKRDTSHCKDAFSFTHYNISESLNQFSNGDYSYVSDAFIAFCKMNSSLLLESRTKFLDTFTQKNSNLN